MEPVDLDSRDGSDPNNPSALACTRTWNPRFAAKTGIVCLTSARGRRRSASQRQVECLSLGEIAAAAELTVIRSA
jgi:hypothetical protein